MAIIPSMPGVQAQVRVNGARAEEFAKNPEDDTDKSTTRYIEAVSGARFTIHYKVWHPYDLQGRDIAAKIWVDGKSIAGRVLSYYTYDIRKGEMNVEGIRTFQQGKPAMAPMVFADLDVVENNADTSSPEVEKQIAYAGEICIKLYKGRATVKLPSDSTITIDEIGKIPEDALKGRTLSHQVKLQEYEPTTQYNMCSFVPDREGKIATFVFRYRSKSALQAEGIIPRTPPPTPLEERPLEELSSEELRELLRRHRERDAAASVVKREFKAEDVGDDSKTDVDHAESDLEVTAVRPVKRQRISKPDEVIDLTGS